MHTVCSRGKPNMRLVRKDCSPVLQALMHEGIAFEPEHRPSFAELAQRFCPLDVFLAKHLQVNKEVKLIEIELVFFFRVSLHVNSSCEIFPRPSA